MAGATTVHEEGCDNVLDKQQRREGKINEVQTLRFSALSILLREKCQQLEELKRKVKEYGQRFSDQDTNINGLKTRIKELEEEVRMLKQNCETSRKDLTDTRKKLREVEFKNNRLEEEFKAIQGDKNIIYLGEMCRKLQENVYRYVFPDKIKISTLVSYKIKQIEDYIKTIKKLTEQERREAKVRWEKLKTVVNPEIFNLIEEIQNLRNNSAHPEITDDFKDVVFKAAEELNEEGVFEFMASFDDVNELIRIWEKTEDLLKKKKKENNP